MLFLELNAIQLGMLVIFTVGLAVDLNMPNNNYAEIKVKNYEEAETTIFRFNMRNILLFYNI